MSCRSFPNGLCEVGFVAHINRDEYDEVVGRAKFYRAGLL